MKIQFKLGLMAAGVLLLSSCEKHDPVADNMQIGQYVPTCYWEVGSTACKAGSNFTFKGKYYTEEGHTPARSEVWYGVTLEESAAATVKLAGNNLSYTLTVSGIDTVRTSQVMATYLHSDSLWNGHEFELIDSVPTSLTFAPISWMNLATWDDDAQKRFERYYPADFVDTFKTRVIGYMTDVKTAANYYNALKAVYLSYPFDNGLVGRVNNAHNTNLPTDILFNTGDQGMDQKSKYWYAADSITGKIVKYYYNRVDSTVKVTEEGESEVVYITVPVEIATSEVTNINATTKVGTLIADASVVCYPVFDSAEWLFCRYDDNKGAIVTTVRENYLPAFADLFWEIPFTDWIYDGKNYAVTFTREFILKASFKVYDTDGNVGVASNVYDITIN